MAVLSNTNLTLADVAKRMDPDGKMAVVANLLSQTNEILEDSVFVKANGKTHHRVTIATGLPDVYWRQLNQGVPPSKSRTAQVDEGIGMLEARSETDTVAAKISGNENRFRMQESMQHMEAMNQEMATTMIYGDPATTPAAYAGFNLRYSAIAGAANAQNVISAGGTVATSQCSILLVGWGDQTIFNTFPEGSVAGLDHRNLGEQTAYYADGTRLQVYADLFTWHCGLVVKDWRYAVRICNIPTAAVTSLTNVGGSDQTPGSTSNILHLMIQAMNRIPNWGMCRPAFYMPRTIYTALMRIALEKSSSALSIREATTQFGTPARYMDFLGVPIRRVDAMTLTEAVVT